MKRTPPTSSNWRNRFECLKNACSAHFASGYWMCNCIPYPNIHQHTLYYAFLQSLVLQIFKLVLTSCSSSFYWTNRSCLCTAYPTAKWNKKFNVFHIFFALPTVTWLENKYFFVIVATIMFICPLIILYASLLVVFVYW